MGSPINWSSEYQFEAVQVSLDTKTSTRECLQIERVKVQRLNQILFIPLCRKVLVIANISIPGVKQPRDRDEIKCTIPYFTTTITVYLLQLLQRHPKLVSYLYITIHGLSLMLWSPSNYDTFVVCFSLVYDHSSTKAHLYFNILVGVSTNYSSWLYFYRRLRTIWWIFRSIWIIYTYTLVFTAPT